jgi:predicted outer membrane repeat protein
VIRAVVARTLAVLLVAAASAPRRARADAVVGTGAAGSCTEAALDAALAGGGNVTFNCGRSAVTITITFEKTIGAATSIDGGGLITLSGGGTTSVLWVNRGVTLTVANLTISDAGFGASSFGGAIYNNDGALTVTNSAFSGNSAEDGYGGAIYNHGGTLTVTNSTFSGNSASGEGGAIYNAGGTLTVTNSTFSDNSASDGGAIYNGGTATVTNSTLSGNSASADGGGIYNGPDCTTSPCRGSTLTVTNSTFSDNNGSGGGIANYGGTAALTNTIVANSTGGNCLGAVTDGGHNLDDGTSCGFSTTSGSLSNTNPLLDPTALANNGGPTQTIALQAGSPAINAGNESVCAAPPVNNLDQRGFVRPGTGHTNCSIGAYEGGAPAQEEEDGCQIRTGASMPWLLFLPVAALVWLRRRPR